MSRASLIFIADQIVPAALSLLPPKMRSSRATAMLLAIGLQESRFTFRRQVNGPARGFWQFEEDGGVRGVLDHGATRPVILPILETLRYGMRASDCYEAIMHNDVLACIFARLLLWTDPLTLPMSDDEGRGWLIYRNAWRPGRPIRESWPVCFAQAWDYLLEKGLT